MKPLDTDSCEGSPQSDPEGKEREISPFVATSLQVLHTSLRCALLFWDLTSLCLGSACHPQTLCGCGFHFVSASFIFSPQMLTFRILGSFFRFVCMGVDNNLPRESTSLMETPRTNITPLDLLLMAEP